METARPPAPHTLGGKLMRSIAKIVKLRRASTAGSSPDAASTTTRKHQFPDYYDGCSLLSQTEVREDDIKKRAQSREATESLLALVFAGVSAVKAAYAQIQLAQSPYDPETIQSSDRALVMELKRLSQLKHAFLHQHFSGYLVQHLSPDAQLVAEIHEQKNLLKTFQITAKKLEVELQHKDGEISSLRQQLQVLEKEQSSLEAKLGPHRSLSSLDELHLSGLSPTHFLTALRYAVKSIRSFSKLISRQMETCGWDLTAAAAAIEPMVVLEKPEQRKFVFQSYVSRTMFSNFHLPDFGVPDATTKDRKSYFEEFLEWKSAKPKQLLELERNLASPFGEFCRAKYSALVHPKMEASFFGNLDQRTTLSSDVPPDTAFFRSFSEMARRVWLLHRLFFAFEPGAYAGVFQVRRGCRFSEMYMESVVEEERAPEGRSPAVVGFTVVPGFRLRGTVIQCSVYLSRRDSDGRS